LANNIRTYRVRDPVHGLIVFEAEGDDARRDQTAWRLLNTPEFQRLRRIRQLGVSEFTFPGATHSRFAHSIGVFHTARSLLKVLRRSSNDVTFDPHKADTAVLAALVHDIGHGPFSHAFETIQKSRGVEKRHEKWTAEIVQNRSGNIFPILEDFRAGMADAVGRLLTSENPRDEYDAVVSSSFDADRLDYLRRDRMMTGSGAGAIDFDWLVDNIRVAEVSLAADDEEGGPTFRTFCLDQKALQAAESFLLARYHLFEQVYLHKTTRGVETLTRELLKKIAQAASEKRATKLIGLHNDDPLVRFFAPKGETLDNYLALDDFAVWSSIARVAAGTDREAVELSQCLLERRLYKAIDINREFPTLPNETIEETERRRQTLIAKIDAYVDEKSLGASVLKDSEPISVYGEVGGDEAKRHKKMSVMIGDGSTREITQLSPAIQALVGKRSIVRYFFKDDSIRKRILAEIKHAAQ
jgi:HD superfamily phosphohydrolase